MPEVRIVDEEGEQLGVLPIQEARRLADEKGLDLVEVSPGASPPVCRLMDYGKFKYQATRKLREARRLRKGSLVNELREVRMKTRISGHDRSAKVRVVKRLLDKGAKVKISIMFRGRERSHPELGMGLLKAVAEDLVDEARLESAPSFEGRDLSMVLVPNLKSNSSQNQTKNETKKELNSAQA